MDHRERHGQLRVRLHHGIVLVQGLGAQPVIVRHAIDGGRAVADRAISAGAAAARQAKAHEGASWGSSWAALIDVEQAVRWVLAIVVVVVRVLVRLQDVRDAVRL